MDPRGNSSDPEAGLDGGLFTIEPPNGPPLICPGGPTSELCDCPCAIAAMERDVRRRSTELSAEEFLEEERRREAVRILGMEEAKKRGVRQKDKAKEVRLLPSISPTPHAAFHTTLQAHDDLVSACQQGA